MGKILIDQIAELQGTKLKKRCLNRYQKGCYRGDKGLQPASKTIRNVSTGQTTRELPPTTMASTNWQCPVYFEGRAFTSNLVESVYMQECFVPITSVITDKWLTPHHTTPFNSNWIGIQILIMLSHIFGGQSQISKFKQKRNRFMHFSQVKLMAIMKYRVRALRIFQLINEL